MKEKIIVWISILLLVLVLLFPPYGYTRYTVTTLTRPTGTVPPHETHLVVPCTYVRHTFILSAPSTYDARIWKIQEDDPQNHPILAVVDDMHILWPVMGVEAAIILLIAIGSIFTLRSKPVK